MPIIEWAQWPGLGESVVSANQMVSGMTAAEAQAALGTQQVTLSNGATLEVVNTSNIAGAKPPIQFPGADAAQAAGQYASSGGLTSATGAAVSSGSVTQSANLAMTETASGATGIGALLSVNLPTAAAAIAPVAGVALGGLLYSAAPEFWEKISRALLPFCYPDTELMPVIADESGNTYYPEEAIDAVRSVLEDSASLEVAYPLEETFPFLDGKLTPYPFTFVSGITTAKLIYTATSQSGTTRTYTTSLTFSSPVNIVFWITTYDARIHFSASSSNSFTLTNQDSSPQPSGFGNASGWRGSKEYSADGRTAYVMTAFTSGLYSIDNAYMEGSGVPLLTYTESRNVGRAIGWLMECGAEMTYPEGISKWEGAQYPPNLQALKLVTGINPDGSTLTRPYFPVATPFGDPGVSVNPLEVPEPDRNPKPGPAINPWISPQPSPLEYPAGVPQSNPANLPNNVPNYNPNLNPDADPSQAPQTDPAPDTDPAEKPGDSGETPPSQIPIVVPIISSAGGLLHVYNPTQDEIDAFGAWLWTTFSGDLIDTVSKLFNDPMDAVIGLHELYASPAISGSSTIKAGFLDSKVSSNLVGSRYTSINCGSVVVQEFYQNYLDYSPYTKCYIYLPFVGIVPVLADDIIGNAVNIKYNVDSYTGCCIAVVTVAREGYSSTVYQFQGNCAVEIPITSGYQSTMMSGMLGIAGAALTGNPHVGLAASNLGRASLGKNDVSHSGSFGASYGAMGAKIPYIIVKRPTQKSVVNYNQEYGFPSHKRVIIGSCTGYLRAREVHVISPTATDEEKIRIEELLKSGVFVK